MEKIIGELLSQQTSIRRAGLILALLGAVICSSIGIVILILVPEITGDLFLTLGPLLCPCTFILYAARYCGRRAQEFEQGLSLPYKLPIFRGSIRGHGRAMKSYSSISTILMAMILFAGPTLAEPQPLTKAQAIKHLSVSPTKPLGLSYEFLSAINTPAALSMIRDKREWQTFDKDFADDLNFLQSKLHGSIEIGNGDLKQEKAVITEEADQRPQLTYKQWGFSSLTLWLASR